MKYENTSTLISEWRSLNKLGQKALALKLGYRSAQFISNIERGLCLLPVKKFNKLSRVLGLDLELIKTAYIADISEEINRVIYKR